MKQANNCVTPEEHHGPDPNRKVYASRNDIKFDDDSSVDHDSDIQEDEEAILSKTSMAYLQKQRANLEKEINRNQALMEVEAQK